MVLEIKPRAVLTKPVYLQVTQVYCDLWISEVSVRDHDVAHCLRACDEALHDDRKHVAKGSCHLMAIRKQR